MAPRAAFLLALLLLAITPAVGSAADQSSPVLIGQVSRVTDGDTIQVTLPSGRLRVRLASIDAPERGQPGGRDATRALAARLKGRQVGLEVVEQRDGFDRAVAIVWLGDENVNEWLVRQGYAWAFRGRYLHDRRYCVLEREARADRVGLWGRAERNYAPWEWRHVRPGQYDRLRDYERETPEECAGAAPAASTPAVSQPLPLTPVPEREPPPQPLASVPPPASTAPGCAIKGNISRNGRIYHLPGSPSYQRTLIDESQGERWFCSEDQARASGWRAPRD